MCQLTGVKPTHWWQHQPSSSINDAGFINYYSKNMSNKLVETAAAHCQRFLQTAVPAIWWRVLNDVITISV